VNKPESPADRILDEISALDWTQSMLAEVIGRPAQSISEIINGKKEITRRTAMELGAALKTPAEEWLQLQDAYKLWELDRSARVQSELALIRDRAKRAVRKPRPVRPSYSVTWSEEKRKHVATVDTHPDLAAMAGSAEYALRKLRALVAKARKEQRASA
jgi:addiction module HigA family antidote